MIKVTTSTLPFSSGRTINGKIKRYKVTTPKGFSVGKNIGDRLQSKYILFYENGKIIKKIEKTLGIFCFKDFNSALYFANQWVGSELCETRRVNSLIIKEVIPLSKAIRKPRVIAGKISEIDLFYQSDQKENKSDEIPEGTVIYDKIKVVGNLSKVSVDYDRTNFSSRR